MANTRRPFPRFGAVAMLSIMLVASTAAAQDGSVSAALMVRAVSGSFGSDSRSHVLYVPVVLRVDTGRLELGGYFPYVSSEQATVALSQGGFVPMQGSLTSSPTTGMSMSGSRPGMMGGTPPAVPPGSSSVTAFSQSGMGDIVGSVGYRIVDRPASGLQVALTGRFKLPTASAARGLGTGRVDVGASAAVRRQLESGWMYAEAGYVHVGDPDGIDLRNSVVWMAGGGRRLSRRVYLLGSVFGNTALLRNFGAPAEVGAGLGWHIAEHLNLTVLPSAGLSRASPSYAITVGLSTRMWRREKL